MPKIPGISSICAVRTLQKAGYRVIREGQHTAMSNCDTFLTIPRHNPIDAYTMGSIAIDADLTADEFRKLL